MSDSTPGSTHGETQAQGFFSAERAKTFADAVVAIAMTLLILPLMESVAEVADADKSAAHWFGDHGQQLLSFILSFAIIAMFWMTHHRVFATVETVTTPLLWIIMAWLLSIVWLPVATAMSGQMSGDDGFVETVYIGSMVLTALLMLAQRIYLRAHPVLHHISDASITRGIAADISTAVLFAVALGITLLFPVVSYFSLFIMFLVGPLQRLVVRLLPRAA